MSQSYAYSQGIEEVKGHEHMGLVVGERVISYSQVEAELLQYPYVDEVGVIALYAEGHAQKLYIYITPVSILNEEQVNDLLKGIEGYVQDYFELNLPVAVRTRSQLPITRSGKIKRTVLAEWAETPEDIFS